MTHLQIALNLARLGYYVHPLAPKSKVPILEHGSNDATRDETTIRTWWKAEPHANVGISLDKSGLVDVSADRPEWAERFVTKGMPDTTRYASGGGDGHWHALYRLPTGGPVARACVSKQYDIMSQGNAVAPGSTHPDGPCYELITDLLPVEDLPLAPAWAVEMLQAHTSADRKAHTPEDWAALPSGAVLAHSRRFQALIKVNAQLRAVVSGEGVTIAGDNSTSIQRAVFVNQLVKLSEPFPHDEIRALALHFQGILESDPKWFADDIDRLLFKYTPKAYKPVSTGVIVQALRGGRHRVLTAGELLDWLLEHADCGPLGLKADWTRGEIAEALDVSYGTIQRCERELIEADAMRREMSADRQRSIVTDLSPSAWESRSKRATERSDQTLPSAHQPNPAHTSPIQDRTDVRSKLEMPQQEAPNAPEIAVCEEQARDLEITHSPGQPSPAPAPLHRAAAPRPVASAAGPTATQGACVLSDHADPDAVFWATAEELDDGALDDWLTGPEGVWLSLLASRPSRRDLETHVRELARCADAPRWYLRDYTAFSDRALRAEGWRLLALIQPLAIQEARSTLSTSPPSPSTHAHRADHLLAA